MKLKPLHDWAVLVPSTADQRTAGGLFIPETAKEKPKEGVVESVGPGVYEEEEQAKKEGREERMFLPTVVKPGDRVLYESWAGQNYKIGSEERVLVRERSILGLIERPVEIPAVTTGPSETAVVEHRESLPARKSEQDSLLMTLMPEKTKPAEKHAEKKTMKKTAKKSVKKTVKKSPSKTAKKIVKKAAKKNSSKTAEKAVKKAAGKSTAKTAKKSAQKTVKTGQAKPAKKAVKKAAKKSGLKTTKSVKASRTKKSAKKK